MFRSLAGFLLLVALMPPHMLASAIFQPVQTYDVSATSITAADVNLDGKIDLVMANGSSISVMLGNGDGTFQSPVSYAITSTAIAIAVADVNGDGYPDALVATTAGYSVLLGSSGGSFQAAQNYSITSQGGPNSVAVADVNGDGKPDLLLCFGTAPNQPDSGNSAVLVLLGKGDGTFGTPKSYPITGAVFAGSLVVADMNRDGKPDLVVMNSSDPSLRVNRGAVAILLGKGDGTFTQEPQLYPMGGFNGGGLAVADLNGDGYPDVVVANECGYNKCDVSTVGVLLNNGDGTLGAVKIYGSGGWSAAGVAIADVNGDGIPDALVYNYCNVISICADSQLGVFLGAGNGTFKTFPRYGLGQFNASPTVTGSPIAVGDANGDGIPDVFVINSGGVGVLLSLSPTTTKVTSNMNPSVQGQAVTFTATVTSAGPAVPTGEVVVSNNGHPIGSAMLNGGVATITKKDLPVGSLSITATYKGDSLSLKDTSAPIIQVVNAPSQ